MTPLRKGIAFIVFGLVPLLVGCGCQDGSEPQSGRPSDFHAGMGDRVGVWQGGQLVRWYERAEADGLQFEFVQMWLTPGWEANWASQDELLRMIANGYTPIIVHFYFGDNISVEYVEEHLEEWYEDIERLASHIDIDEEVWVVLEPEFNTPPPPGESPIIEWEGWNDIVIGAVKRIRQGAPKSQIGICAGDFREENLDLCLSRAATTLDFLAFQEMRGSTDHWASTPDYLRVADSAIRFSSYLKSAFSKPILLAYLAISTYADGDPRGWEAEQASVFAEIWDRSSELSANGVFGIIYFEYYDVPEHGGYFGEAEDHWGLIDKDGKSKLGWSVWKEKTERASAGSSGIVKIVLP